MHVVRLSLLVLCTFAPCAFAQLSPEEAHAKLLERQRQRPATVPSTAPAKPVVRAAAPVKGPTKTIVRVRLKDDAPANLRNWFSTFPLRKAEAIARVAEFMAEKNREIARIEAIPVPKVKVGANARGVPEMGPDPRAAQQKSDLLRKLRADLLPYKKAADKMADDDRVILEGQTPIQLRQNSSGNVRDLGLKVVQVMDKVNLVASIKDSQQVVWMTGFDTTSLSTGAALTYDGLVTCTGEKLYARSTSGNSTVLVMEPLDFGPWIVTDTIQVPLSPSGPVASAASRSGGVAVLKAAPLAAPATAGQPATATVTDALAEALGKVFDEADRVNAVAPPATLTTVQASQWQKDRNAVIESIGARLQSTEYDTLVDVNDVVPLQNVAADFPLHQVRLSVYPKTAVNGYVATVGRPELHVTLIAADDRYANSVKGDRLRTHVRILFVNMSQRVAVVQAAEAAISPPPAPASPAVPATRLPTVPPSVPSPNPPARR